MEGNPTKALKSSILQFPLLFRRPVGFPGFLASKAAEMGGTPQKHQKRRFCNTRSFSEGNFQGPLYFLDFRLPKPLNWGEHHTSTKIVDFAIPAPFPEAISKAPCISGFPASIAAEMGGTLKSTKIVDFAIPAPFPEALSRRFPGFLASKAAEMSSIHSKEKFEGPSRPCHAGGPKRAEATPSRSPRQSRTSLNFQVSRAQEEHSFKGKV